ncbi:MAG: hypothetical protein QHC40_11730 [Sphingobium sp.]|nr:hypothetical protein [Sphingobium sp.]
MADDLSEIKERLDYAEGEISAVRKEVAEYVAGRPIESRQKLVGSLLHCQMRISVPIPTAIRARTGGAIHEMRSCLDALTCRLAERNNQNTKQVYFPISKNADIFKTDGMRKIAKLSDADRQVIVELAPFAEADPFLFGMHEFDRTKKHNRLGLSAIGQARMMFHWPQTSIRNGVTMMHGALINADWVTVLTMHPNDRIGLGFHYHVAFEEPEQLKGLEITEAMGRLMVQVRGIVSRFD